MTNNDQKTWLEAEKEAGNLGRVGAADVLVDGAVLSLPGDEALELLAKMGDDDLASSLDASAQGDGDQGAYPIPADGSDTLGGGSEPDPIGVTPEPSTSPSEEPEPKSSESADGGSTPSPSAEFDVAPAADAEVETEPVEPEKK